MRVLHVGKYFAPCPGGMETFLGDLARALDGLGVTQELLVHAHEPGAPTIRETVPGLPRVGLTRVGILGTLGYAPIPPGFPLALARLVRRFRPDLLHLHLPNASAFAALLPGIVPRRLPLIIHWHADVVAEKRLSPLGLLLPAYRVGERALLARARTVIATSPPYLATSPQLAPWRAKCAVVPLGLDARRLPKPDPERVAAIRAGTGGRALVLGVGRFSHYKGFGVLLEAVARLPGIFLVLAGDGELRPELLRMAEELGLEGRAHFPGRVDDAELHALYAACDVFCLPSVERTEAFGLVLLEAMRHGRPVVATSIPGSGTSFVAEHGRTGLVVPPRDVTALAAALADLTGNLELASRLGEAGRRRFDGLFGIETVAERVKNIYVCGITR